MSNWLSAFLLLGIAVELTFFSAKHPSAGNAGENAPVALA